MTSKGVDEADQLTRLVGSYYDSDALVNDLVAVFGPDVEDLCRPSVRRRSKYLKGGHVDRVPRKALTTKATECRRNSLRAMVADAVGQMLRDGLVRESLPFLRVRRQSQLERKGVDLSEDALEQRSRFGARCAGSLELGHENLRRDIGQVRVQRAYGEDSDGAKKFLLLSRTRATTAPLRILAGAERVRIEDRLQGSHTCEIFLECGMRPRGHETGSDLRRLRPATASRYGATPKPLRLGIGDI